MTDIIKIQEEIKKELSNKKVMEALVATTFKGLAVPQIYLAIQEGILRGFEFKDFLEKNVYAIPFKGGYSLITSIDYARKIAMRSGFAGQSAPIFTYKTDGKLDTCTITVKRSVDGLVGDYTATVKFDEYFKAGRNGYPSLWESKPTTMLVKVATMHALRAGFPEEMAKQYIDEEMEKEKDILPEIKIDEFKIKLEETKTLEELKTVWSALPIKAKEALEEVKNNLKSKHEIK